MVKLLFQQGTAISEEVLQFNSEIEYGINESLSYKNKT